MKKKDLEVEIESAIEQLKDYTKFIDLMRDKDDPKGVLTRLYNTISRIKMLLELSELKDLEHPKNNAIENPVFGKRGSLVKIRPCAEKYENKTYLGFLIGDVALGSSITLTENKIQLNFARHNPAIFVPELGEVIFGIASWWGGIKSEEELKEITNSDIDNVWYVKALKSLK